MKYIFFDLQIIYSFKIGFNFQCNVITFYAAVPIVMSKNNYANKQLLRNSMIFVLLKEYFILLDQLSKNFFLKVTII